VTFKQIHTHAYTHTQTASCAHAYTYSLAHTHTRTKGLARTKPFRRQLGNFKSVNCQEQIIIYA